MHRNLPVGEPLDAGGDLRTASPGTLSNETIIVSYVAFQALKTIDGKTVCQGRNTAKPESRFAKACGAEDDRPQLAARGLNRTSFSFGLSIDAIIGGDINGSE